MPTIYDELPYPGAPYAQTHPDRLAVMATLFGMNPAPIESCRVLELGCGDGGNLIPMAFTLPSSQFVGLDLAESAIAKARDLVGALNLTNISLRQQDLMEVGADLGEFDYIIAHGLISWVPAQVRERILEICNSHLAPNGVAFISYNTYPGGHLRDILRGMMLFHTRGVPTARERIARARELLQFLVEAHPQGDVHGMFLRAEIEAFLERKPEHFYHDELGEHNARFYFHEFVEKAGRNGLQFLSEVRLLSMQTGVYPAKVSEKLRDFTGGDDLVNEQYLDFLKLRNFRQSLFCRAAVRLDRKPKAELVMRLSAASDARSSSPEQDVRSAEAMEFRYPNGGNMSTNHPLAKAALLHLGSAWPQSVPFSELLQIARDRSGRDAADGGAPLIDDSNWLSDMVLKLYAANFLDLHSGLLPFTCKALERPVASALARAQVRTGSTVTNLRHASVEIEDDGAKQLLLLLDGTRGRHELLQQVRELFQTPDIPAEQLETNLDRLSKLALLAG